MNPAQVCADLIIKYLMPECQRLGKEINQTPCTPVVIGFLAFLVMRGLPMSDARETIRKIVRT